MNPSVFRIFAISIFSRDAGIRTDSWPAAVALRMRVSMSAIGSLMFTRRLLPTRLYDARQIAFERVQTETDAAQAELPDKPARTPTQHAPVAVLRCLPRWAIALGDHCFGCQRF